MTSNLKTAIEALVAQGYIVRSLDSRSLRFDIDGRLIATPRDILELAAGTYSVAELQDRFVLRLSER
jgi:hypothetical protein